MSPLRTVRFTSRRGTLLSLTRLDWFALFLSTESVMLFAVSMVLSPSHGNSLVTSLKNTPWLHSSVQRLTVDNVLLIFLALEVLLLLWLWMEFPRRRRTENALRKINSLQRAIARSSARIVGLSSAEIGEGLHDELDGIREILGVDRICWYQQSDDGSNFIRLQTASA